MTDGIEITSTTLIKPNLYWTSLVAGGAAGLVVDIALFPIDTVKTRLQSERGFWRSGGFKGIYKGIGATATGSTPTAALFFFTYESMKSYLSQGNIKQQSPYVHMLAASCGEVIACLIRVPVEIAKQRKQALIAKKENTFQILYDAFKKEGLRKGVYRGFGITIMREVPFSLIQFPLWEYLKVQWEPSTGLPLNPAVVALCGAISGGIAAGLTTPLDVLKTRIMLADASNRTTVSKIIKSIYRENGIRGLFAGFVPRVLWITLGGAIFFGVYDLMTNILHSRETKR